ncbi:HAMP domain-containing sensor histidine kinase [Ktedonosporobacter rubrisoli]|uniref:histidine kinase n=1 Tax=Ktedonosporobacter rubrisoli TaxID=2509675 RepID=A0A4P6K2A6_KTERU|nr:HAMP domain-containing sensor histidine kinase [Ktedonosporobacter rubrisoli]QBD82264.1 HAMP domain-containing sensor histidine kinase [Ktedonosporobacter rubrisoli]
MGDWLSLAAREVIMKRRRRFWLQAEPGRAIIETVLLGAGLAFLWFLFAEQASLLYAEQLGTWIDPCCLLWYVFRLRLSSESVLSRRAVIDVSLICLLSLALSLVLVVVGARAFGHSWPLIILAIVVGNAFAFVVCRLGIRLWLFWDRLRRTQLIWSLTHAHLVVVALGAGLVILLFDILVIVNSFSSARGEIALIVPTTLALAVVSLLAILVILPPSALFSFLVVRRITRRLQSLTSATGALRNGNYAVRVPIEGEDEVAQLQSDFNAMATALELTMQELQNERDTVAELLSSRRELIANVSHELRTPVATLRGYLETTLMRWNGSSPSTLQHDLKVMEAEVINMQRLVEDLFTLSRAEVGRLALQCKLIDVGDIIRHIVETTAPTIWQSSKITLAAEIPATLPVVLGDPIRLEQVLQNLVRNALRHTTPGGIIALVVEAEPDTILLHVKDTGEGIAPKDLPRIWERFYQTETTRTRMDGGAGLGLALVKEWVELMQGSVSVESVLGEGSCFTISLPIQAQIPPVLNQGSALKSDIS